MPGDLSHEIFKKLFRFVGFACYRLEVNGREHIITQLDTLGNGAIIAANHESIMDAFLLGLVAYNPPELNRTFFLGKHSALWKTRMGSKIMDYFDVIPVKKKTDEAVRRGLAVIKNKQVLGIFPEGHTTYYKKTLEGKVGVARFAFETEAPIIPAGIIGTDHFLPFGSHWTQFGQKVTLTIGKPIHLNDKYSKKDIYDYDSLREATDLVMKQIRSLSNGYGIHPKDATQLRSCEDLDQVLISNKHISLHHFLNEFQKKNKSVPAVASYSEWLSQLESHSLGASVKPGEKESPPPNHFTKEYIIWLNNQI